jgi:hypothetical protein
MYARQLAWLGSAVPGADGKPSTTSRAQQIQADGGRVCLPELRGATYLLQYLQSAGLCAQGMAGAVALSSAELMAWCQGMRRTLAAWEFAAILTASRAYCDQLNTATDAPPWGDIDELSDPAVISKRMAKALSGLARPVGRSNKKKR